MTALSPISRRLLAVALLVLVLIGLWSLLIQPLAARHAANEAQILQSRELLARYQAIIGSEERLLRELEALQEAESTSGGLLATDNPSVGSAEIQKQLKDFVTESGGALKSTAILPTEERSAFQRIAVRLNVICDTPALQELLYSIESANPYLFVDNLDVRTRNARRRQRDQPAVDQLQVRLDVSGYIQVGET